MTKKVLSSKTIGIGLITLILLGFISVIGSMLGGIQFNNIMGANLNPAIDQSVNEIGKLIQQGERAAVIQQQLDGSVSHNKQLKNLFVINQEALIIAAGDRSAIGLSLPLQFISNSIKGVPLPFNHQSNYLPKRSTLYPLKENQDLNVFEKYQSPDKMVYYVVGAFPVSPEMSAQQAHMVSMITGFMLIYRICFILSWLLLALWVYLDARRRHSNAAAWGILTLLTSVIGWVVYLLARPIVITCPACGEEQGQDGKYCTNCGAIIKTCCPQCSCEIKPTWHYCKTCGFKLSD